MLDSVISQYLQVNRRLIVPQLGAFLVKEPDHKVVFSALLTHDDGLLRELLMAQGASEIEASGLIDRLLFDIRFAMENNQGFTLNGVGRFRAGENGAILFEAFAIKPILEVQPTPPPKIHEPTPPVESIVEAKPQTIEAEPDLGKFVYKETRQKGGRSRSSRQAKSGGIDLWLIIGVLAIALAVSVILYGFLREGADNSAITSLLGQVITK